MTGFRNVLLGAALAVAVVTSVALVRSGDGRDSGAAVAATPQPPATQPLTPYLRFTGTGTARVKPDRASIWFSTRGESASKGTAVDSSSGAMRKVIAAMRNDGVKRGDLQTDVEVDHDTTRGVYQAYESLQVTVRDVSATRRLIRDGLNAGADSVSGPNFSLASQTAGYAAALRAAISDARSRATAAAGLIGAHVTSVVSVDDVPISGPLPYDGVYAAAQAVRGPVTVIPVEHGMQQVTATVTVVFSYAAD
jgi:uncharacterized protein YggE